MILNFNVIKNYITPVYNADLSDEEFVLDDHHLGKAIKRFGVDFIDEQQHFDLAILGVSEMRGSKWFTARQTENSVNPVRAAFYNLYQWHDNCAIIDMGNLKQGKTLQDTYIALREICEVFLRSKVRLLILGGSHDLLVPQYQAFQALEREVRLANVDALIDLDREKRHFEYNYLERIFFDKPNMIQDYTHIAFQSYFTHPKVLGILDDLNCNCFRLGYVKDQIYEVEPDIRLADLFAFDLSAVATAYVPTSQLSSNGLSGEDACMLTRFAGMSDKACILGIYGYYSFLPQQAISAQLIAQMMWYVIEGIYFKNKEGDLEDKDNFNIYYLSSGHMKMAFYQSKVTKRWWMKIKEGLIVPCSYSDYVRSTRNEIPDRWLKFQ